MSLKIKTFCRCHHLQSKEIQQPIIYDVDLDSNTFYIENSKLSYADYSLEIKKNKYKFDKLYEETPQKEISQDLLKLLIRDVFLNKKKCLLIALGIGNSGKSFTISGNNQEPGILQNTIKTLLDLKESLKRKKLKKNENFINNEEIKDSILNSGVLDFDDFDIFLESFEIYNEEIIDLMVDSTKKKEKKLEIIEISKKIFIKNLRKAEITDFSEAIELMSEILKRRTVSENLNSFPSSRSHVFYKIIVTLNYSSEGNSKEMLIPIMFVDIAGIYKYKIEQEFSANLNRENGLLNKSIFFLDRVINFTYMNQESLGKNTPFYKESKLTMILIEFLCDISQNYFIFHVNGMNQANEYKEVQTLLEDIGIFSESKKKIVKKETDSIKNEVKKSIKKSEKILSSFIDGLNNVLEDKQGKYLSNFIKSSSNRVNMIRAGRRLDNLISDDTELYKNNLKQINKILNKDEKKENMKKRKTLAINSTLQQLPEKNQEKISQINNNNNNNIQKRPNTQSKIENSNNILINKSRVIDNNAKEFSKFKSRGVSGFQINKFEELIKETQNFSSVVNNYQKNKVFDKNVEVEKFKNLKQYYVEKFKCMSKFLSEEDLNQYLGRINQNIKILNNTSQNINTKLPEDAENLEILKFLEKEEEKSESRIKKIIKINTEIQTKLLQENHLFKLQQLQELRLQQNRQLFKLIDELPSKFSQSNDPFLFIHKRPETSDDALLKRNFLRYKPMKTQQNATNLLKAENLIGYNPNIDPKNQLFENLFFQQSNGFNSSSLNINNIQNSFINNEKKLMKNTIRACTSDEKYRILKAADCKSSFLSTKQFFKAAVTNDLDTKKNLNETNNNSLEPKNGKNNAYIENENNQKILKPSQKKNDKPDAKQNELGDLKLTLEKWKNLPESLRTMILQKNQQKYDNVDVLSSKYLTKFNQTQYHLKAKKNKKAETNRKKYDSPVEKKNQKPIDINGLGFEYIYANKNYEIYRDENLNLNAINHNENQKLHLFNYIDSSEWNNNFENKN